jgi:hypothetical protein
VTDGERRAERSPTVGDFIANLAGHAADALKDWEPRRLLYNAVLALVVLGHVLAAWPESRRRLTVDAALGLSFLAVLANICYCAVYAVDLFAQFSGLHQTWQRGRIALLVIGTAFAAVITHFFVASMLAAG